MKKRYSKYFLTLLLLAVLLTGCTGKAKTEANETAETDSTLDTTDEDSPSGTENSDSTPDTTDSNSSSETKNSDSTLDTTDGNSSSEAEGSDSTLDTANDTSAAEAESGDSAAGIESDASSQITFEGQDIEGNTVSSAIFSNAKLTMLNVWATYCNPCLSEMPGLGELANEYDSEQFQIVGIISDVIEGGDQEAINLAASLIEQTGADYTHLLLNESIYYALLTEVTAVPTTFFIDENGVIVDMAVGAMEKSDWEEKINALLE